MTSEGKGLNTTSRKVTGVPGILNQRCANKRGADRVYSPTLVPVAAIPIPDFALSCLYYIKHAYSETNVVEDAVCIFLV